jgi:hypothetical protein
MLVGFIFANVTLTSNHEVQPSREVNPASQEAF